MHQSKQKKKEVMFSSKLQLIWHAITTSQVYAIVSFDGSVQNQPVLYSVVCTCAFAFVRSGEVLLFFWSANILLQSRLGYKTHGSQWHRITTTLMKPHAGSIFSALRNIHSSTFHYLQVAYYVTWYMYTGSCLHPLADNPLLFIIKCFICLHFFLFFKAEISSCTPIPLFRPGTVSWNTCELVSIPGQVACELISLTSYMFPHYAGTA